MKTPDHLLIRRDDVRKREMLPKRRAPTLVMGHIVRMGPDDEEGTPYDEAVIHLEGDEDSEIEIHCPGALRLAPIIVKAVNSHDDLVKALEFYADPFVWKKKHDPEDVVRIPDFYSETSFGDMAGEALAALRSVEPPGGEVRETCATCGEPWIDGTPCDRKDGLEADCRLATRPAPPLDRNARREQYARIINPELFVEYDLLVKQGTVAENGKPWAEVVFGTKIQRLLETADALLALDSNDGAQREVGAALERTLSQYDKTIDRAKEDAALSDSGRERIIQDCLAAKAAVRSFAGNLSALSVSVRSGVQSDIEQTNSGVRSPTSGEG